MDYDIKYVARERKEGFLLQFSEFVRLVFRGIKIRNKNADFGAKTLAFI
jgi:hypothetical protein